VLSRKQFALHDGQRRGRRWWTAVEHDVGQHVTAVTYMVPRPTTEGNPARRYVEMIREGARQRGLPADYIAALDRAEARE